MKTFAHVSPEGEILGIGIIYVGNKLSSAVQEFVDKFGEDAGIVAYGDKVRPVRLDTDTGEVIADTTKLIDTEQMPGDNPNGYDKTFRSAFRHGGNLAVVEDTEEARKVTHERRRAKRTVEMAPHDAVVAMNLPDGSATAAENERKKIRKKYDDIQNKVDAAVDAKELRKLIAEEKL